MKADEQAGRSSGLIKSSFIGIRVTQNVRSAPLRAGAYEVERRAGGAALSLRDGVVSVSAAKWPSATIATGITAILAGGEHSGKRGSKKSGAGGTATPLGRAWLVARPQGIRQKLGYGGAPSPSNLLSFRMATLLAASRPWAASVAITARRPGAIS